MSRRSCRQDGCAGHLVPETRESFHHPHLRRPLVLKEDSELQGYWPRRGMTVAEFLGVALLLGYVALVAFRWAVWEGQEILEEIQDSMSETERSERLGARSKKDTHKTKKARNPPSQGAQSIRQLSACPESQVQKPQELHSHRELGALGSGSAHESSLSSEGASDPETLDPEDEAELEEEATRYEEERYRPDDCWDRGLGSRPLSRAIPPSRTKPSAPPLMAPPPYEVRIPKFSFISDKVKRKIQSIFPVFEAEGGRIFAPVEYTQIKELAESVRKYGVNANFTLVQLERLANAAMTPTDWQTVAKAALPDMGQYLEWRALWFEAAQSQAQSNAVALTPEQRDWSFDMLTGQGRFAADQTNYPWGVYVQVSQVAIKAWKSLSRKGDANRQLTKIIQGPQESFSDFVARMTEAAGRIFGDALQFEPFIEQLIFEQATQECRTAIAPRKNKGLQDWLRVCRDLGGPLTNAGLAAAILQSQRRPTGRINQKACFNCGKPGHLKKDCRNTKETTLTLCARCGKGYHKASQCRSVRDAQGKLLPPLNTQNQDNTQATVAPKNGLSGPWSQGPQKYGSRFVKTQEDRAQDNPQDWTCVQPPTSY